MLEGYAQIMNFRLMTLPFIYIGIPIGANPKKEETWKAIMEKIEFLAQNFVTCEEGMLNKFSNFLTSSFYMSIFKMPRGVMANIDCKRIFFWGGMIKGGKFVG